MYRRSAGEDNLIYLDDEANNLSDAYYDETTQYRMNNPFKTNNISVISKSRGLVLRIAGALALLRDSMEVVKNEEKNVLVQSEPLMTPDITRKGTSYYQIRCGDSIGYF